MREDDKRRTQMNNTTNGNVWAGKLVGVKTLWYLKDKHGYPIEFQEGKGRIIRIICQNIRKITG